MNIIDETTDFVLTKEAGTNIPAWHCEIDNIDNILVKIKNSLCIFLEKQNIANIIDDHYIIAHNIAIDDFKTYNFDNSEIKQIIAILFSLCKIIDKDNIPNNMYFSIFFTNENASINICINNGNIDLMMLY